MSKGSPTFRCRLPYALVAELERLLTESVTTRKLGPWDASMFIRDAVREKVAKRERGRRRYGKKLPRSASDPSSCAGAHDEKGGATDSVGHLVDNPPPKG